MAKLIRNKITFEPIEEYGNVTEQMNGIRQYLMGDQGFIDFSKIIPFPDNIDPEDLEGDDWLLDNWGTRSQPKNICWLNDTELLFDTELYPALKIIAQIAKDNPNVPFTFKYASEEAGKIAGEAVSTMDMVITFPKNRYSKEAYDIAFELYPHQIGLYATNSETGKYCYDTSDIYYVLENYGQYTDCDGVTVEFASKCPKANTDDLPF